MRHGRLAVHPSVLAIRTAEAEAFGGLLNCPQLFAVWAEAVMKGWEGDQWHSLKEMDKDPFIVATDPLPMHVPAPAAPPAVPDQKVRPPTRPSPSQRHANPLLAKPPQHDSAPLNPDETAEEVTTSSISRPTATSAPRVGTDASAQP